MKRQRGATLVISLIILGVMTVIGVTSMQRSGLELKMISSAHDRNVAFEAVEKALAEIEAGLVLNPPKASHYYSNCSGDECFNPDCKNGRCFAGEFYPDTEKSQCYIADSQSQTQLDFWSDKNLNVWETASHHKTLQVDGLNSSVKYIIEFLCFTNVGAKQGAGYSTQGAQATASEDENYKPLYRITAMASGNANRATVVLQSTYRVAE